MEEQEETVSTVLLSMVPIKLVSFCRPDMFVSHEESLLTEEAGFALWTFARILVSFCF